MPMNVDGLDHLMTDIAGMASAMDADGVGAPTAKCILEEAAVPIHQQMKANASKNPKIISGKHFDDVEGDVLYADPELSFKTKMADIPLIIQEMIFGNRIDDNGVLIRASTDKPPYFAVGFKSEKSNHKYRYIWLFKVRAKPVTETYATRAGTTVTRQTGEIEWKAIKRTHDNQYQAVADEDQNGFDAAKAEAFLQSVYIPSFNAEAGS